MRIILFLTSFLLMYGFARGQKDSLAGEVRDAQTNAPLEGVSIILPKLQRGTATDSNGQFRLKNLPRNPLLLRISSLGYESYHRRLSPGEDWQELEIQVQPSSDPLPEVIVMGGLFRTREETPYSTVQVSRKKLALGGEISLMQSISEEPGLDMVSLGPAIAKPVIRGLSFSRVLTVYQGMRLENQQWGADHGLWASSTGVAGAEVIKGPASIIYGSGALGGVIQLKDATPPPPGEVEGRYRSSYHSNSLGTLQEISLRGQTEERLSYAIHQSQQHHADYRAGNGQTVGNSRFHNRNFRAQVGWQPSLGTMSLTYHQIDQDLGIVAEDERQNSRATFRSDRSMILPFQRIQDRMLSFQSRFSLADTSSLQINLGYHGNSRRELEEAFDQTDLGLALQTFSYDAKYQFYPGSGWEVTAGTQGFFQTNRNLAGAEELLIPNAQFWDGGLYGLASYDAERWSFLGGLRVDRRELEAQAPSPQYRFPVSGAPREDQRSFQGWTASAGISYLLHPELRLKANAAKGFRAPDLAELYSNGAHPGTQRYELGNPAFDREENLQADLQLEGQHQKWNWRVEGFYNAIQRYTFFAPTEQRQGDLQVWQFQQGDAFIAGGEASLSWRPAADWEIHHHSSYQQGQLSSTGSPLPLIPPLQGLSRLSYRWGRAEISLKHRYVARQGHTAPDERPTAGYQLVDALVSYYLRSSWGEGRIALSAHNLANVTYLRHMSLLREFNIWPPGRNLRLKIMWKI